MPSAPTNPLSKTYQAARMGRVFLGDAGAVRADLRNELEHLVCLSVTQSAGGRRLDHATFAYDLGRTGERLKDLQTPVGWDRIIEVRLSDDETVEADAFPVFWGDLTAQEIAIDPRGGENAILTARIEPYLFGDALTGYAVWDVVAQAQVTIPDDPAFNPLIDGIVEPNKARRIDDGLGKYDLWLHPEAVRTAAARSLQTGSASAGAQLWTLQQAINALVWTVNDTQLYVTNPDTGLVPQRTGTVDSLGGSALFDGIPPLLNLRLRRGGHIPEYLDDLLAPHGLSWYLALALVNTDIDDPTSPLILEPTVALFKLGEGPQKELHHQDVGADLDLTASDVHQLEVTTDIADLANEITGHGSRQQKEVTIELYRGFPEADDSLTPEELHKPDEDHTDSQFETHQNAWRLWVGNEDGGYGGLRTGAVAPIPVVPLNLQTAFDLIPPRRRKLEDCLTRDAEGKRRPRLLEYYDPDAADWKTAPNWGQRWLEDQIGVYFDAAAIPEDLRALGNNARLRVTGTVTEDARPSATKSLSGISANAKTVEMFLDLSDRFHKRSVENAGAWTGLDALGDHGPFTSRFAGSTPYGADVRDDSAALAAYVATVRNVSESAEITAQFLLAGIHTEFEIGDVITRIAGREIDLNRNSTASPTKRYVQVMERRFDFQQQQTALIVRAVDLPAPRHP